MIDTTDISLAADRLIVKFVAILDKEFHPVDELFTHN
jgi:hypothetical protein